MGDEMKSAYEIALEKLKDAGDGAGEGPVLTPEQKAKIKEINVDYDAKIAEKEIMLKAGMKQAAGAMDPANPGVAAGAVMNQHQGSNLGADLYNGTLVL